MNTWMMSTRGRGARWAAVGIGSLLMAAGVTSRASAEHTQLEQVSTGPTGGGSLDRQEAPPAKIRIYLGNGQNGPVGTPLPDPLCTNVLDAGGHLLHGIMVTYVVASGGGTIADPATPRTDPNGIATSGLWKLGPGTGEERLRICP